MSKRQINMWILIVIVIYSVQFAGITADTEIIPPKTVEAFYGDVVSFTCNTSLPEVFWMEDDQSVRGNWTYIDGWTLSVHQVTVTRNVTVNCFGKPAEDNFDTAQIILLEGPPTMMTTVATVADDNAPLQVNLQSGFGSLQEGDSTNVSLTLTITNVSLSENISLSENVSSLSHNVRLPTHFGVDLQTSAGENATIYSPTYQPENLNTTMNITIFWTPDDSANVCNLYLTLTVSAVNSVGSSMPSNPMELFIGCETIETPPGFDCGAGCVVGITLAVCVVVFCILATIVIWQCCSSHVTDFTDDTGTTRRQ